MLERKDARWENLKSLSKSILKRRGCDNKYYERLEFEFAETEKQEATQYWVRLFKRNHKYETNKNGLVLPWALAMTPIDPFTSEHQIIRQTDVPDIDFDCIPDVRDEIKRYATEKYGVPGEIRVCSVGTWMTYKFKSALQDTARAVSPDLLQKVIELNGKLPMDVDDLKDDCAAACTDCGIFHSDAHCPKCGSPDTEGITLGQAIRDIPELSLFNDAYPQIVSLASRLVGRIKCLGKHAGGLIISNSNLFGNIPLSRSNDQWVSMWTEGRNTQLSKLGCVKWDVLGLSTLKYIHECCKLIEKTRGHKFNIIPWKGMDPEIQCAGYFTDENGVEHMIKMDDAEAIKAADEIKMETVFQFETDVQKGVLSNGVKSFSDLQIFNAMGHPGPILCMSGETLINTDAGYIRIDALDPARDQIQFVGSDKRIKTTKNYKVFKTGKQKTIRIKLSDGRTIRVTKTHKIFSSLGIKQAGDLKIEDKLYVQKRTNN